MPMQGIPVQYFNSIKVQLRHHHNQKTYTTQKFQFHKGTIKIYFH